MFLDSIVHGTGGFYEFMMLSTNVNTPQWSLGIVTKLDEVHSFELFKTNQQNLPSGIVNVQISIILYDYRIIFNVNNNYSNFYEYI